MTKNKLAKCVAGFVLVVLTSNNSFIFEQNDNLKEKQEQHDFAFNPHKKEPVQTSQSSSSSENQKQQSSPTKSTDHNREPRIILQIGPHKTGTTALQSFIHKKRGVRESLLEDRVAVPFFSDMPGRIQAIPDFNFAHCMIKTYAVGGGDMSMRACQKDIFPNFTRFVSAQYQEGNDILMVAEDLDRHNIDYERIIQFVKPYTRIDVVVIYRRLHDWYPSWYNQVMKTYTRYRYIKDKNQNIETFVDYLKRGEKGLLSRHTVALADDYSKYGMNVTVLNYHEDGVDLFENLFCKILQIPKTCAKIQSGKLVGGHQNRNNDNMELCRVILTAQFKFGIGEGTQNARTCYKQATMLEERMKTKFNMTIQDLPLLRIPQSTIDDTWKTTVDIEKKYAFEKQGNSSQTSSDDYWLKLREDFDRTVRKKWFSIDVDEMNRTRLLHSLF
jgi:hypothetical protein